MSLSQTLTQFFVYTPSKIGTRTGKNAVSSCPHSKLGYGRARQLSRQTHACVNEELEGWVQA
jgi:hypothetical protein